MEIILIAAMAANRVIGRNNTIPWHLPGEQQRFKRLTMGHALVMGRRTYQSIGRPLPGRRTVVVSRNPAYTAPGCTVVQGLDDAITACAGEEKIFIAGGGAIYRLALARADALYLTTLHREVEGEVLFPVFSEQEFELVEQEEVAGEEEPYTFAVWRRR